jgi:hypothetical protein
MLIWADYEDKTYARKFSSEQEMNDFVIKYEEDIIVLGTKTIH